MKYIIMIGIVFLSNTISIFGEEVKEFSKEKKNEISYGLRISLFLEIIAKKEYAKAYDFLLENSSIREIEGQVANLVSQTESIVNQFAIHLNGGTKICEIKYSEKIVYLVYYQESKKLPLYWHFYFYNSKDYNWILTHVKVNYSPFELPEHCSKE